MKAKTKFTRLWSILLALAMVVGMLPTTVLAAGSATATADFVSDPTTALTLLNAAKTGDTNSTWDSTTKTLTLGGVNFETTAATAVKLPDDAKIVLNGENTLKGSNSDSSDCYGIYGEGDLTISGSGTLNVTAGEAGGSSLSFGIHAEANVTINSGAVTATGGEAPGNQSLGIRALNGNLTINGGTVTATGSDAKNSSNGLWAGNGSVTISGGKVVANGGGASSGTSSGIYAKNVVIQNTDNRIPHVTTRGGNGVRSRGIYANGGNLEISGGVVIAKAGYSDSAFALNKAPTLPTTPYWWRTSDSGDYSKSAYTGDGSAAHLEIWNWDPTATADFTDDSEAALARLNAAKTGAADSTWDPDTKTLTLNGVDFTTTAATAVKLPDGSTIVLNGDNTIKGGNSDSGDCYGIEGLGNLTIQGTGTLNVTGGTTSRTAYDSFGIRAYAVTIKSGTVIAKGGTAQMTEGSMSGGIDVSDITIEGGIVEATGGAAWRSCGFNIVALGNMYISGGTVTATGGTSDHYSYGIYTNYSAYVHITGGSLIAKAGSAPSAKALPWAPDTLPDIYWWRSSDSGQYKKGYFNWDDVSTYVEIGDTEPITTYTVTFDANGGTDTMADVTGVSGDYTLPANGFTAPEGKQFKAWSVNGTEKAVGDKIAVSADTTVKAVWENIPAAPTEYNILDGANSSWTQDSDGNLSVRGSGAFSEFVGVKVDGKLVDEKYYTVKEGSTIVTLKADYLNTCTVGSHTLEIIWTDGSASTAFTVSAQTVVEPPQTGDNSMMWIWIALLVVSGIGVMGTIIYIRKKKHSGK